MIISIVSILFYISASILLAYWISLFSQIAIHKVQPQQTKNFPPVSVVIAARNEESNLRANLPSVLTQNYPNYEVIVIDDHSTDRTREMLELFKGRYEHLQVLSAEKEKTGKKAALTAGVSKARHQLILTTDADCRPSGDQWINGMIQNIGNKEVILGYGPHERSHGMLNAFIRFETIMTAVQYFSWALARRPYMGVGRNLMYRKSVFKEVGGFETHHQILSGDDDLFVQEASVDHTTGVCLDKSTFMFSQAKSTLKEFLHQKNRHMSTSRRYQPIHQIGLTLFAGAQMLFYPTFIWYCLIQQSFAAWITFLVTIIIRMVLLYPISKKLGARDLFIVFPLLDFIYSMYLWALVPKVLFPNPIEWKSSENTFQKSTLNKKPN